MRVEGGSSFPDRVIGAARCRVAIFEEVRDDDGATGQAFAVVVLASIVTGIGSFGTFDPDAEFSRATNLVVSAGITVLSVLVWAGVALAYVLVGTRVIPGTATRGAGVTLDRVARTTGFATSASLLNVFSIVPGIGLVIPLIASVLVLIAGIVAIRTTFAVSIGRAIAIEVLTGLFVVLIVAVPLCALLLAA